MPEDPGVHQVKRSLFVEREGLKRRMGGGRSRTRFSEKLWDLEKIVVLFGGGEEEADRTQGILGGENLEDQRS